MMDDYIKKLEEHIEELQDKLAKFEGYNILKIKTLENEWTDCDHLMLHAIFGILTNFVENEWHGIVPIVENNEINEGEYVKNNRENAEKRELFDLYLWWKNEYQELEKDPKWHIKGYETETNKAMRVCELRKYLWT
jgi:hypothetical protein